MSNNPSLDPNDIRVLGVLIEKQRTVPDTYPLSLNSLLAGCNQKTSRDPVMTLSEAEVAQSLDKLRGMSLVMESSGSRVSRYGHNIERVMAIPTQSSAIRPRADRTAAPAEIAGCQPAPANPAYRN